jgi:hypothetical protein
VVIAVKLIYGTGIGNDVMDGAELMNSWFNSKMPPRVVVASLLALFPNFYKIVSLKLNLSDHHMLRRAFI